MAADDSGSAGEARGRSGSGGRPRAPTGPTGTRHGWRIFGIWLVLSAIGDPLFYYLAGPHIPPGKMSSTATGAQFDFNILFICALPVILGVWIYMAYAIVNWRASRGGPEPSRWSQSA